MVKIVFRYRDEMSHGEWRTQQCVVRDRAECIRLYGLDTDPTVYDWEILEEKEVDEQWHTQE